jgi:hypothetical protein
LDAKTWKDDEKEMKTVNGEEEEKVKSTWNVDGSKGKVRECCGEEEIEG